MDLTAQLLKLITPFHTAEPPVCQTVWAAPQLHLFFFSFLLGSFLAPELAAVFWVIYSSADISVLNNGLDDNEIIFGAAAVGNWWIQWRQQLTKCISDSTLSGRCDHIFIQPSESITAQLSKREAQLLKLASFLAEILFLLSVQLQILKFHAN